MTEDKGAGEGAAWAAGQLALGQSGAKAEAFLDEQTRLAQIQIEQHREENATRRRLLKLEHASAVFKLALEVAVAAVAAAVLIALGTAMWSAANDSGLVVESFSVPPDLAGRGLTGEVVAAKLLDKLSSLQSQTVSSRAPTSYANNWGSDIKLQIPDTGVSIGEFNRSLHAWLGHQTRITGEVYRTPAGLAVTARAGNATSPTFTGSDADLDKLIRQAAESVYRATQPYRYAVFLANVGRNKEAEAAYLDLIANGSAKDRAWAHIGIENIYANRGDRVHALAMLKNALALKPGFIMAYVNEAGIEGQFQHDEAGLAAMRRAVAVARGPRDSDLSDIAWTLNLLQSESNLASDLGAYKDQLEFDRQIQALPDFNNSVGNARQSDVTTLAFLHDAAASEAAFALLPDPTNDLGQLQRNGTHSFARMLLGDPRLTLALRDKFDASLMKLGGLGSVIAQRQFWPVAAFAMALTGDLKGAHALADRMPADCNQCLRAHGLIDMLEKNWRGADYWFARAVRDAPSVPFPYSDWGRALLAKGDTDRAIARFAAAHDRGPRYADPLEYWGEALTRKGRADLALAKFEEAARLTPNWARLHRQWGLALSYLGRKDEAARELALARSLGG